MHVPLGIGHFYAMVPEPLQDAPEEIALDRGDAVLRVVNPHPYFQVDGIISQTCYKVGRFRIFENPQGIRSRRQHQFPGFLQIRTVGNANGNP